MSVTQPQADVIDDQIRFKAAGEAEIGLEAVCPIENTFTPGLRDRIDPHVKGECT